MIQLITPALDASTIEGQLQWFVYGFGFGSVPCSIALAIRIFKRAAPGATFEN